MRIATGVVQGIAFGADLPVVPVSSLAAMAQGVYETEGAARVLCAFDARMGQVYWGAYAATDGRVALSGREVVCDPGQVPAVEGNGWVGAGTGWAAHGEAMARVVGGVLHGRLPDAMPRASGLARLARQDFLAGRAVSAEQAQPVYLRDQVAEKA